MPAHQIDADLARFVADIDRLRDLVNALRVAALSQDSNDGTFAKVYWPSVMETIARSIPATTLLEDTIPDTFAELRALSMHGARASASGAAQGAAAKTTKRAELAGASARE